jgi:hypothetical protein
MLAVGMVQMAAYQIVHMVCVGHSLMAAIGAMHVAGLMLVAAVLRRASVGIGAAGRQPVLIHMTVVNVMQMPVVQVVRVAIMLNGGMAAIGPVDVCVAFVFGARFSHKIVASEGMIRRVERDVNRGAGGLVRTNPLARAHPAVGLPRHKTTPMTTSRAAVAQVPAAR